MSYQSIQFSEMTYSECWCCSGISPFTYSVRIYKINHLRFRPPTISNTSNKDLPVTVPSLIEHQAFHRILYHTLFDMAESI